MVVEEGRSRRRNVTGLKARARQKAEATRLRVEEAIRLLVKERRPVSFKAVAETAPCSTAWLYSQPDIKERIAGLRAQQQQSPKVTIPARERASDASKDTVIAALRKANKELREENAMLRRQMEVVYGELRARQQGDITGVRPAGPV